MSDRDSMMGKAKEMHPYAKIAAGLVGFLVIIGPGISSLVIQGTSDTEEKTDLSYKLLKEYIELLRSEVDSLREEVRYRYAPSPYPTWRYGRAMGEAPPVIEEAPLPTVFEPSPQPTAMTARIAETVPNEDVSDDDDGEEGAEECEEETEKAAPTTLPILEPPEKLFPPEIPRKKVEPRPSAKQLLLPKNLDDAMLIRRKK